MRDWSSRVEPDGTQIWELRRGGHVAAVRFTKLASSVDLVLTVDNEIVRSRAFRADQQDELAAELNEMLTTTHHSFEPKG